MPKQHNTLVHIDGTIETWDQTVPDHSTPAKTTPLVEAEVSVTVDVAAFDAATVKLNAATTVAAVRAATADGFAALRP